MKPNIRWQLLLAVVCLGLILSLLSFQVQSVGLCTTRVPAAGGSLVEGMVGAPRYLNPLLSDSNPVDRQITSLIFDGLMSYDSDGELVPALARDWQVSDDGRTVSFRLRDDVTWHDGEPVTAADVVFSYELLQSEKFPAPASLRALWQTIEISQTGPYTVTFTLPEPYSPFLDATTRGIVPQHLLAGVPVSQISEHSFNQRPVGTGPFMVPAGDDWRRSGQLRLLPNPAFWGESVSLDDVEVRFFPDLATLTEAFEAGEIQAINSVPASTFAEVAKTTDAHLYTTTQPRFTQLLFNLSESGSPALQQREVRQALAYALDRKALIDKALRGQGVPLSGPYTPNSWAYNPSALTIFARQPLSATQLLDQSGWTLAEGAQVRQHEDQALTLRLLAIDNPVHRAVAAALAEQWAGVGVQLQLDAKPLAGYMQALGERSFDAALLDLASESDPDLYDFWSQPAIVNGHNYAAWNNRRASEALEQARQTWNVAERKAYYDAFMQIFSAAVPAISLYQQVYTYAVSDDVQNVDIGKIDYPRDRYASMQNWFLLYRDVAVSCPEPTNLPGVQ
ncbi:MAG TPA: ABC transporter substrate-binding protein [Candidatus Binatia bacterium]|nr:ABC transporter substrate-binding protein [Candidatus Binatia bacterium]